MRAINHALTGAVIGLTVSDPLIAVPLAFASHFVMDAIPHSSLTKDGHVNSSFVIQVILDAVLCVILVAILAVNRPIHFVAAIVCAFVAAMPDFFSINCFISGLKGKIWKPNLYSRFAFKIQWFEKPIGIVVEAAWLIGFISFLSIFLHH